jgi:hypothetical protein
MLMKLIIVVASSTSGSAQQIITQPYKLRFNHVVHVGSTDELSKFAPMGERVINL